MSRGPDQAVVATLFDDVGGPAEDSRSREGRREELLIERQVGVYHLRHQPLSQAGARFLALCRERWKV